MICIAATNFPQSLDKALIRPGRFDRHVTVPNPDVKGRKEILEVHFKNVPAGKDVDLKVQQLKPPHPTDCNACLSNARGGGGGGAVFSQHAHSSPQPKVHASHLKGFVSHEQHDSHEEQDSHGKQN